MHKDSNVKARELSFYTLFSSSSGKTDIDESLRMILLEPDAIGIRGIIQNRIRLWKKNKDKIDQDISELLKKGSLEDLSFVALSALRLGFCEMEYDKDIPYRVAINEAVELAKKFGDQATARFVNAIMDARLKRIREKGESDENKEK